MAQLTAQPIVDAGTNVTYGAVTASDTAPIGNGHQNFAHYKNVSASVVTVTVLGQGNESYGVAKPSNVISLAANTGEALIPLRKDYDNGTGNAVITTSAQTSVTVAIVSVAF